MIRRISKLLAAVLAAAMLCAPCLAAPIPSRADNDSATSRDADLGSIQDVLARDDVARALSAHGLTNEDIESRLDRLSDQDLRDLASNLSQIQAGGEEVPKYIWWLAGGLMGVLILAAIL